MIINCGKRTFLQPSFLSPEKRKHVCIFFQIRILRYISREMDENCGAIRLMGYTVVASILTGLFFSFIGKLSWLRTVFTWSTVIKRLPHRKILRS